MRTALISIVSAVFLVACASEGSAPAQSKSATAEKPAPRCYNGDDGKFYPVGQKAVVSGVEVNCTATSDGKSGQWMGAKHK
jgi:hypothetical protein